MIKWALILLKDIILTTLIKGSKHELAKVITYHVNLAVEKDYVYKTKENRKTIFINRSKHNNNHHKLKGRKYK